MFGLAFGCHRLTLYSLSLLQCVCLIFIRRNENVNWTPYYGLNGIISDLLNVTFNDFDGAYTHTHSLTQMTNKKKNCQILQWNRLCRIWFNVKCKNNILLFQLQSNAVWQMYYRLAHFITIIGSISLIHTYTLFVC